MDDNNKTFTFTFKGKNAQEIAERFAAYFWDGGLDQYIEQEFLEQFELDLDNVQMDGLYHAIIDSNNAKM